jgi:predicted MFS family arabinose efflux permease
VWGSSVVSSLGSGVTLTALPLYAAATGGRGAVAVVAAAEAAPGLLLALPSGVLADRFDRRTLMLRADLARCLALLLAGVALAARVSDVAVLVVLAFVLGAGETLFRAASRALVPALVDGDDLDAANGRLVAAEDVCLTLIGPPLGAALFAIGRPVPLVFDAVSFVVSAFQLARLRTTLRVGGPTTTLRDAFGVLRHSRMLRALVVTTFVCATCGGVAFTLLVLVADEQLGVGPAGFGLLVSLLACGGVTGSLLVEHVRADRRAVLTIAVLVNALSYAWFASAKSWMAALPPLLVWGASISAGMVVSLTMRQQVTGEETRGRVLAMFQVAAAAGSLLGAITAGALSAIGGLQYPYLAIAAVQGVIGIGVWTALADEAAPAPTTT